MAKDKEKSKGILGGQATKVFDILGEIMAFLTIVLIVLLFANEQWGFITNMDLLGKLYTVQTYATLTTVSVVCLEFAAKRGLVLFLIIAALVAVAFIFSFLPDVANSIRDRLFILFQ